MRLPNTPWQDSFFPDFVFARLLTLTHNTASQFDVPIFDRLSIPNIFAVYDQVFFHSSNAERTNCMHTHFSQYYSTRDPENLNHRGLIYIKRITASLCTIHNGAQAEMQLAQVSQRAEWPSPSDHLQVSARHTVSYALSACQPDRLSSS